MSPLVIGAENMLIAFCIGVIPNANQTGCPGYDTNLYPVVRGVESTFDCHYF